MYHVYTPCIVYIDICKNRSVDESSSKWKWLAAPPKRCRHGASIHIIARTQLPRSKVGARTAGDGFHRFTMCEIKVHQVEQIRYTPKRSQDSVKLLEKPHFLFTHCPHWRNLPSPLLSPLSTERIWKCLTGFSQSSIYMTMEVMKVIGFPCFSLYSSIIW